MRSYSMKPVIFPIVLSLVLGSVGSPSSDRGALAGGGHARLQAGLGVVAGRGGERLAIVDLAERALVLVGEHLHELRPVDGPVVEQFARALAAGPAVVVLEQLLQLGLVGQAVV